jgi:hypothetical protein
MDTVLGVNLLVIEILEVRYECNLICWSSALIFAMTSFSKLDLKSQPGFSARYRNV